MTAETQSRGPDNEAGGNAEAGGTNRAGDSRPKLRLDSYLKYMGITPTGGQAKVRVQAGEVRVNGSVETRRGRGLKPGDVIEVDGETYIVDI